MKTTTKTILTLAGTALVCTSLHAAVVVNEPFAGTAGLADVDTQVGGLGIDGNWRGSWNTGFMDIQDADMNAGDYGSTGRQLHMKSHSVGFEASATLDGTLSGAGLLDNGATLWFSYLVDQSTGTGWAPNSWSGFALGTSDFDSSSNGAFLTDAGEAIGVQTRFNNPYKPAAWVGGGESASSQGATGLTNAGAGVTQLIVGKIEWGAEFANETITLYSPGLNDLGNLGTGHSLSVADMAQADFDTITMSRRESETQFDEIRFGATSDDVLGVPEPSSAALLGLGGLALIFRRRK